MQEQDEDGAPAVMARPKAPTDPRPGEGEDLVPRHDASLAGREALARHLEWSSPGPSQWDAARRRLQLAGYDFEGANLAEADLTGADLKGCRFARAIARSAKLDDAILELVDVTDGDFSGASFRRVAAGQVVFAGAMLEDANFEEATMRFARLEGASLDGARFTGADLWGANLRGADADDAVFANARLEDANLSDVNLTHTDFTRANLKRTKFVGSRLKGADFASANLDGADLSRADLTEANLERLNLSSCRLTHAHFSGAILSGTRMRVEQLGGVTGEEAAGDFAAAQESYLALEQNFKSIGAAEGASWAYKRGRRMGKRHAAALARQAYRDRDLRNAARHGWRWTVDRFVEWLCDYGESMSRIIRAVALAIVLFAISYGITGGMVLDGPERAVTRNPLDMITYSALNMLTANPPDIGIKPTGRVTNLLVGIEGATGIILLGLFGFVLGNRLRQ